MRWEYMLVLGSYMLVLLYIGLRTYRREATEEDFWLAQRKMPGWWVGFSIAATRIPAYWCFYVASLTYKYGISSWFMTGWPMAVLFISMFLLPKYVRRVPAISQPEMMGLRFGPAARTLLVPVIVYAWSTIMATEFIVLGKIARDAMGLPYWAGYFGAAAILAFYLCLGGYRAVVITDIFQVICLFLTFSLTAVGAVWLVTEQTGGSFWTAVTQHAPVESSSGHFFDWAGAGILTIVMLVVSQNFMWTVETDLWIRLQSAKSRQESLRAIWSSGLGYFWPSAILPTLVGAAALVLYPPVGGKVSPMLGGDPEAIFPALIRDYFPPWIDALMVTGIFAASNSSCSTMGNNVALALGHDVFARMIRRRRTVTERDLVLMGRIASVLAIAFACALGYTAASLQTLMFFWVGMIAATMPIPLWSMYWRRTTAPAALGSMIAGGLSCLVIAYFEKQGHTFGPAFIRESGISYMIYSFLIAVAAFVIGLRFGEPATEKQIAPFRDGRKDAGRDGSPWGI